MNNSALSLDILDHHAIQQLPGYESSAKQAECLSKHNIYYVVGKNGQISTTSTWLSQACTTSVINAANDEVNLDF